MDACLRRLDGDQGQGGMCWEVNGLFGQSVRRSDSINDASLEREIEHYYADAIDGREEHTHRGGECMHAT